MSQDFHQIGPQIWESYKFGSLANLGALQIWGGCSKFAQQIWNTLVIWKLIWKEI